MSATPPPPPPGGASPPPGGTPPPPSGGSPPDPSQPAQPDPNQPGYGAPPPAAGYQTPPPTPGYTPPPAGGQINYGTQPEKKSGLPGWAWVLIVVGGLTFLLCGGGFIACAFVLDEAGDDIDNAIDEVSEPVAEDEYDLEIEDCDVDEFGSVTVGGTVTNDTGERQAFEVVVEVKEDGTVVQTPSAFTNSVDDGDTTTWSTFATADEGADIECELVEVNKSFGDEDDLFGD